ncbi:tetratricopeptide repeat protein [Aureibaculum sp. A20]|uniref:Tetratricopeptide repeat protein n=1 Tax=Aureibaculum flavum TaxID=2795986 RepID=A0ABS0WWS1_9FLAO|nr:tetratricopeptide repeat protein [Aureibaculum flavum]MBJ2176446.1 tetratricopeptide repeat protein [Aureibaculum flavum]
MKIIINILFIFFVTITYAQKDNFERFLAEGKAEFNKSFEEQDYDVAVKVLERAVQLKPENTEAKYFLGYAYSRLNAKDGASLISMKLDLTIKSSEQFEAINKLTPKYEGEIVVLDPYSKITSEWGSMAMTYWHKGQNDQALWAFNEGKKRGGFSDFILGLNKEILDACDENAILFTSGDQLTIPLWYLQIVEGYRKDIAIVDANLLESSWYATYLVNQKVVTFDLPEETLDNLEIQEWTPQKITIDDFSWTVKPTYEETYLFRCDLLLLSILKANNFERPVFFTDGFPEERQLNLTDNLWSYGFLVDAINLYDDGAIELDYDMIEMQKLMSLANENSPDEIWFVEFLKRL